MALPTNAPLIKAITLDGKNIIIRVPLKHSAAKAIATFLMDGCTKASVITNSACATFPSIIALEHINEPTIQQALIRASNHLSGIDTAHWRLECTRQILYATSTEIEERVWCKHYKPSDFGITPASPTNIPVLANTLADTIAKRDLMQNQGNLPRATKLQADIENHANRIGLALRSADEAAFMLLINNNMRHIVSRLQIELQEVITPTINVNRHITYATALCVATACQTWTTYLAKRINRCLNGLPADTKRCDITWFEN